MTTPTIACNPHPDAPHGFSRDDSHSEDRYVCLCESWYPASAGAGEVQLPRGIDPVLVQHERARQLAERHAIRCYKEGMFSYRGLAAFWAEYERQFFAYASPHGGREAHAVDARELEANSVVSRNEANAGGNAVHCGRGCACLTQCGDYYDSHNIPLPPGPYPLDRAMSEAIRAAVLAEREANAKLCDQIERQQDIDNGAANTGGAEACAAAIRNRGKDGRK